MNIEGTSPPTISLHGTHGRFNIGSGGIQLNYMLTIANGRNKNDHSEFLGLLKPMRERVELDSIRSLEEILQRDVDDRRVASGIVEYLMGNAGRDELPAFFPSIVVLLVPNVIFELPESYPLGVRRQVAGSKGYVLDYGSYWSFEPLMDNSGSESVLGKLTVHKKEVWPIVIDGQHRTMGFRFVAGSYELGAGKSATYDKFYETQIDRRPRELDADLPVTILWFDKESGGSLDILEFSRQLFLDINQSSQQIAESRKILLSDSDPISLLTRTFYDWLVKEQGVGRGEGFGLFHSGFDFPENLGKRLDWAPTSVFVPELFRFALLQFLLLPSQENSVAGRRQGKLYALDRGVQPSFETFDLWFDDGSWRRYVGLDVDIEGNTKRFVRSKELRDELTAKMYSGLSSKLWEVLNWYGPIRTVVQGCFELQEERDTKTGFFEGALSTRFECWDRIFCGGTGLYYSVSKSNQSNMDALKAEVKACENALHYKCAAEVGMDLEDWRWIRSKVLTKAGIIGLFLAYKRVLSLSPVIDVAHEAFVAGLKGIDWELHFFPFMKSMSKVSYIKDLDPKSWAAFRDIILLFVINISEDIDDDVQASFERNIFLLELDIKLKGHASSISVPIEEIRQRAFTQNWNDDLTLDLFRGWVDELKNLLAEIMESGSFEVANEDWSYSRVK